MKKIIHLIFENFEEIESIVPIDLLRRAGACVEILTLNPSLETTGRTNIKILADKTFDDFAGDFDMLVISGGSGVFDILNNIKLLNFVRKAKLENKEIAAICAAPLILKEAGVLEDKKCTGHTSIVAELGTLYEDSPCVIDGNITTSQGAGTAFTFAFALMKKLFGEEKVAEISKSICY